MYDSAYITCDNDLYLDHASIYVHKVVSSPFVYSFVAKRIRDIAVGYQHVLYVTKHVCYGYGKNKYGCLDPACVTIDHHYPKLLAENILKISCGSHSSGLIIVDMEVVLRGRYLEQPKILFPIKSIKLGNNLGIIMTKDGRIFVSLDIKHESFHQIQSKLKVISIDCDDLLIAYIDKN